MTLVVPNRFGKIFRRDDSPENKRSCLKRWRKGSNPMILFRMAVVCIETDKRSEMINIDGNPSSSYDLADRHVRPIQCLI